MNRSLQRLAVLKTLAELQRYFTAEDRRQWVFLLAASLTAGVAQSLALAVFNHAVGVYGQGRPNWGYMPVVVVLAAIAIVAGYLGAVRGHIAATRMAMRLREQFLDQLGAANLRVIERVGPSAMHYHIMATTGNLASAYGTLLGFATSLVMLACNAIYIGWLSPLGLLATAVVTTFGLVVHFRQERLNVDRKWLLEQISNGISARHREVLDGYKELRLVRSKWGDYRERIGRENTKMLDQGLAVTKTTKVGDLATYFFQSLLILIMVFVLPLFAQLEAVVIMHLMTAILVALGPLSGVVGAIPGFTRAQVALQNLRMIKGEIAATREPAHTPADRKLPPFASIELRGVEFAFEDDATGESFRLGPIDLKLENGEVVFIVGGNGSGKTVLLRILTALYHPGAGTIYFNGEPLAPEDRQAYRELFSTVFSDFHLFRELLGQGQVSEAEVNAWIARLDLAGKTQFADGQFTTVALSAGQRKRLAFAIAALEDRPIYVLDEFGAEQDPEHRRVFYHELIPYLRASGKLVVVVSHDDAYFSAADRVIRMDFGRIVSDERVARPVANPIADRGGPSDAAQAAGTAAHAAAERAAAL